VTKPTTDALLLAALIAIAPFGCAWDVTPELDVQVAPGADESAVIVAGVDWTDITDLPEDSAERRVSRAVGYLSIPARGTRCTAFLVTPDVVMTNEHCIPNAASAAGAAVSFRRESGVAWNEQATFSCETFLGADADLDYALLRCEGRPGDEHGVLGLDHDEPGVGADVYVVHQNCDYYAQPWCDPVKRYSPGVVVRAWDELHHDADTLGGSSGSPLLSRDGHRVVGLHHVGMGNDGNGRGRGNLAVRISDIRADLAARFVDLELGERLPGATGGVDGDPPADVADNPADAPASAPLDGEGESFEPNDDNAQAAAIVAPFSWDGLQIADDGDVDWYAFSATGAQHTVRVELVHAVGDLDLYVHGSQGEIIAQSISTTDVEEVTLEVPAGTYAVRVVGYGGATGSYNLRLY
jgi:hypothetical protein